MVLNSQTIAHPLWPLSKKDDADTQVEYFLKYLEKTGQTALLSKSLEHLKRLQGKEADFETLTIYSRFQLSQDDIAKIKNIVGAHENVTVNTILNDSIIGSFQVKYRGLIHDGSITHSLTQMKRLLES